MKFLTVAALLLLILVLSPTSRAVQMGALANANAASYSLLIAQDSIASAFGQRLAANITVASSLPLPTSLLGTTVKVIDSAGTERLAPLFFVSPGQINYLVPEGTMVGKATITVTNSAGEVSSGNAQIAATAPGIFTADSNGQGCPAMIVQRVRFDGVVSYEQPCQFINGLNPHHDFQPLKFNPNTEHVYLVVFGTGFRHNSSLLGVTASVCGKQVPVMYAGAQPDFVGLDQINVEVPGSATGCGGNLYFIIDGVTTNSVQFSA